MIDIDLELMYVQVDGGQRMLDLSSMCSRLSDFRSELIIIVVLLIKNLGAVIALSRFIYKNVIDIRPT